MYPSFQDRLEEPFSYEDGPIVFQPSRQGVHRKEVRGCEWGGKKEGGSLILQKEDTLGEKCVQTRVEGQEEKPEDAITLGLTQERFLLILFRMC